MMRVGEACTRTVVVTDSDTTVTDAARIMRQHHVGSLVVVRRNGASEARPVGVVTDRDLVIEVMAKEVAPAGLNVGDIMSRDLVCAQEDDELLATLDRMRDKGIRRMPVVARNGVLVGVLALDDVLELLAEVLTHVPQLVRREHQAEARGRPDQIEPKS